MRSCPTWSSRGEGAILNVASVAAFQPIPSNASYGATKAFVHSFSEAINAELAGTGVSMTSLCPGPVATEFGDAAGVGGPGVPAARLHGPVRTRRRPRGDRGDGEGQAVGVPRVGSAGRRLRRTFAPRTLLLPLAARATSRALRDRD